MGVAMSHADRSYYCVMGNPSGGCELLGGSILKVFFVWGELLHLGERAFLYGRLIEHFFGRSLRFLVVLL